MFYSSPETCMHVTQMQLCYWPPRFAYTIHSTLSLSSANKLALFIYSLIIIVLILITLRLNQHIWNVE